MPSCRCLVLTGLTQPSHVLRALQLHVRGFLRKDAPLFLSPATVRNYLSSALAKLDARNRIDRIRKAQDAGWL